MVPRKEIYYIIFYSRPAAGMCVKHGARSSRHIRRKNGMEKRILSTLLALCMVLALLPSEMARADIKYINSRTDLEA